MRAGVRAHAACALAALISAGGFGAGAVHAQELADFDYENLSFRGLGAEVGYVWPTRVDATPSLGVRIDMGYLGPSLRIVPGVSYWSSKMKGSDVRELEARIEELVEGESPLSLGQIDWSDLVLSLDGQLVWRMFSVLGYAGAGAAAHIMNGGGAAIADTFIEDLLDTVTAGANLHLGLEYPLGENLRIYTVSRYEFAEPLRYFELRVGGQLTWGSFAPNETRGP
jgi:hypothetical protein